MKEILMEKALTYFVTAICAVMFGALGAFLKKLWNREEATREGTRSLLRADIIRSYEKYMEKGYCPIYARDALELEYAAYHKLGGNGTITDLMQRLRDLPTSPDGH